MSDRERYERLWRVWRERRSGLAKGALDGLDHAQRIDITFTSNAIEGNTLTAGETALVIEKGITIGGKPLKDHLEVEDHHHALNWVLDVVGREETPLTQADIRTLHRLAMARSDPAIAGQYADRARFVNTNAGLHEFPPPTDVPALMEAFVDWLRQAELSADTAFEAHCRLVAIHPFNDGNGRTARLLMNLILVRSGHPPIALRLEERPAYLAALEDDQAGRGAGAFHDLMLRRLIDTLDFYISAAAQAVSNTIES